MTTPRARYVIEAPEVIVPDFPQSLRQELRKRFERLFTADQIGDHRAFVEHLGSDDWGIAHPADDIVSRLLGAAYPLKVKLYRHKKFALKKGDILAEHADFLKSLRTTQRKLRSLSPELDRLLGNHADPLGIADLMGDLISRVEFATATVKRHPDLQRDRVFNHQVACELALAVLEILSQNNIPPRTSDDREVIDAALVIATLKCIGDAMKLVLEDKTWKNTVAAVRQGKNKAPQAAR